MLHRRIGHGDNFKVIGVVFDSILPVYDAARKITHRGWVAITDVAESTKLLLNNSIFVCCVENVTSTCYHAAPSVLNGIDKQQRRFLRELARALAPSIGNDCDMESLLTTASFTPRRISSR